MARPESEAEHRRVLMVISKSYYIDGKSKVDIADELGISRFRVARYLDEAVRVGIVSITINSGAPMPEMSAMVSQHLKLRNTQVIETYGNEQDVRTTIGRATGTYLRQVLCEGEVLGIGWGRTLNAMLDGLDHLPKVEILELAGRFDADYSNSAAELIRRATALTGSPAKMMPAPFFVDDARLATALRRQPDVAGLIAGFSRLTTAVVAVGILNPASLGIAYSLLPERFSEQIMKSYAVGEVCGNLFARDGSSVKLKLQRHTLAITANQLRQVKRVIMAVSGVIKAEAVRAVCCSGVPTDLVVDVELAKALLQLPKVTECAAQRV